MAFKIKKDDKVVIIAGKDKGKKGKVLTVLPKEERVIVEGANIVRKHARPTQRNPQGGIITQEGGIHISNVQLVCPSCGQPTRVGFIKEGDFKKRYCKKCESQFD